MRETLYQLSQMPSLLGAELSAEINVYFYHYIYRVLVSCEA